MLSWKVWYGDFNSGRIETDDVFDHPGFRDDCRKAARKYAKDKDAFAEAVRKSLMYYFWSKCEWEIILSHWPPSEHSSRFRAEKIDVYDQIMLNWEIFIDYVWEHKGELKNGREQQ